jgi:hypothetical protein
MNSIVPETRVVNDWANTMGGVSVDTSTHNPLVRANRKPFDEVYPRVKTALQLSSIQRINLVQQPTLSDIQSNELTLALTRISGEVVNPIYWSQLVRQIVDYWRAEVVPATTGPMREEDRKAAIRKSDELAVRRLLQGSDSLAKMDAAELAARRAEEIAIEQRRAIEALWFELSGIPKKREQIKDRLDAIAAERGRLNVASLESSYNEIYSAQFSGGNISGGNLNEIWLTIQQAEKRLGILSQTEKKLTEDMERLKQREKVLRKELK